MGFNLHPRGCGIDLDFKVTHNTIRTRGTASIVEKLVCARKNTCGTYYCRWPKEHKPHTDHIEDPDESKCCERVHKRTNCFVNKKCKREMDKLFLDNEQLKEYMCECELTHLYRKNASKCAVWYRCMY